MSEIETLYTQLTQIIGKTYKARIGYVCMETPEPDPCAGLMIDMTLKFKEEYVEVITEEASPCETFRDTLHAFWFTKKDSLLFEPALPYAGKSLLKEDKLWVENHQLRGIRNGSTADEIVFEEK